MSRNLSLDFIRILATFSVVVGHLFQNSVPTFLVPFTKYGGFGVCLFFLLSGYLVTSSVVKNPNWKSFLTLRSFRILPAYFLAFGLYSALKCFSGSSYTIQEVLMYVTFTGYLRGIEPTLNGVEWTLRIEVLFYLIAVVWLYVHQVIAPKLKLQRLHGIVSLLSLQLVMLAVTPTVLSDQRPLTFGQCIVIGILVKLTDKYSPLWKYTILLISLVIAEFSVRLGREHYDNIPFIVMAVILFLIVTPVIVGFRPSLTVAINFAANCTYSVYLYHNWVLRKLLTMNEPTCLAILVFLVSISVTYMLIEKPMNQLGRKVSKGDPSVG
jgi:peptidoglycan/LPS O-acetylase OafA/YrhL